MAYPTRFIYCDLGSMHTVHDLPDGKHSLRFTYRYDSEMPTKRAYVWHLCEKDEWPIIRSGQKRVADVQDAIADFYSQDPAP